MIARPLHACSLLLLLSVAAPVLAAPGDLDPSFGTGGFALGPIGSGFSDVVRQPDGKLVVVGSRSLTPKSFLVARFETDGTLDATFGTGGMVETAIGTAQFTIADDVVLQPDGKIVVAGYYYQGTGSHVAFALARYETDGSLDATFGIGGIVTLGGPGDQYAYALVLQSDGKLVAAGGGFNPSASDWQSVLARFETDGTLDATFGTGGVVTTPGSQVDAILQQPDGKLVAAGYYKADIAHFLDFAVFRYETDGSLDPSFGTGGMASTSISVQRDRAFAIVRQADGGFVVGGSRWDDSTSNDMSLVLVRYDAAGVLDATFGNGGIATQIPNARYDVPVGLTEQPNGKLVMAAHLVVDDVTNIALVRWQTNGTLDTAFGDGGVVTTRVSSPSGAADLAEGVLFEPQGRIVAVGTVGGLRAAVVAYESGFCCTGGPCVECEVCETCGLAGCEPAPIDNKCPDDGNVCTTEGCDGAGTCLHPSGPAGVACDGSVCTTNTCDGMGTCLHIAEPALVCDQPQVAAGARLKMRSSADAGKDRVDFKVAKGTLTSPVDPYTMSLCVYDRSPGGYTLAYQGSPSTPDGVWTFHGTTRLSIKYKSEAGQPDGIKAVALKLASTIDRSTGRVKAAGDLALAPFPLQQNPSVLAQMRWASGQCWGATFSTAVKSDGTQFKAKSD